MVISGATGIKVPIPLPLEFRLTQIIVFPMDGRLLRRFGMSVTEIQKILVIPKYQQQTEILSILGAVVSSG